MNKSEQLIACLEGEIAKRDEELKACRVAVENCEVFRARIAELEDDLKCAHSMLAEVSKAGMALRAELAATKAQEPVGYVVEKRTGSLTALSGVIRASAILEDFVTDGTPLYAAPVSEAKAQDFDPLVCDYCNAETQDPWHGSGMLNGVESRHIHACSQCRNLLPTAKAQGVVQWPESDEIMQMAFEEGHPADDASGYYFELEEFDLFIERLMSEVASLNATPVQQVSVPAWMASSRAFADRLYMAGWRDYADAQHSGVAGMYDELLSAAPAADAPSVEMVQAACAAFRMDISPMLAMHYALCAALAAHRDQGVV